jgi:uncharacterized protein (DUF1684 family)
MTTMTHEEFRRRREARLLADNGWLALVDRILIEEGDNELPIGRLTRTGARLHLVVPPGLVVTCDGAPVTERDVKPENGGKPDVLRLEGRTYEAVWRAGLMSVRVFDPAAPALRSFQSVPYFPEAPQWRLDARFEPHEVSRRVPMPYTTGETVDLDCPGVLAFEVEGQTHRLEVVIEPAPDRLFVLFADRTNRAETYGAGRFLYAPMPQDGQVDLDFNRACNPACVFNPLAICPLPPAGNRLPFRVEAGEKLWP